jgi:serine/threonine-protein kinase RsbW
MSNSSAVSRKPKGLEMVLPARSENVAIVRHVLAGMAEEMGMDEAGLADLKTVVTEACMNVVVHAYGDNPGPLSVEAEPDLEGLTVVVCDEGVGIQPRAEAERPSLRLGLSLIAALSSSFSISGGVNCGTKITMRLPLEGDRVATNGDRPTIKSAPADRTEMVIDRPELLGPVLERMVGALVARRDLPVDRVSDAVLITDAIAAAAPARFADGRVRLDLDDRQDGIKLRLGPMDAGAADHIREELHVPGIGGSLEALADDLTVEVADDGEYLVIDFAPVSA